MYTGGDIFVDDVRSQNRLRHIEVKPQNGAPSRGSDSDTVAHATRVEPSQYVLTKLQLDHFFEHFQNSFSSTGQTAPREDPEPR